MNKEQLNTFISVVLQLHAFYNELSTMSKKSSDSPLNKFKLKFVNQTLNEINTILGSRKPFNDFDAFSEDEMPTNSDVTMILAQYLKSAAQIYQENTKSYNGSRYLALGYENQKVQVDRLHFLEDAYN